MGEIETKVINLIKPKLNNLGYELVSVRYNKENKENYLRIVVDKESDISLDDIVFITDLISPLIDASEILNSKYILDISSVGVEKNIDVSKLEKYIDKYVNIHLSNPYKGLNNIEGTLTDVNKNTVTISYREKTRNILASIERKYIDKANLAIKF